MIHAYQLVVLAPSWRRWSWWRSRAIAWAPSSMCSPRAATLAAGLWLMVSEGVVGDYAIVDEFNVVFIVINTLVGFTTALFSASYIGHEIDTGRLSPASCGSITPCSRR